MRIGDERMTRRTALRAGAVLGIGALAPWAVGCGRESDSGGSGGEPGGGSVGSTTLPAPSLNLLGNAPLHVAAVAGLFRSAGVGVELADVLGTDVVRAVQTQAAVGVAGFIPSSVAFSKAAKELRLVAPMASAAQNTFIAPKGSKVRSLEDLRPGMKVGGALASTPPNYFADRLIRRAGLEPGDEVEIVNLGRAPDAWTAARAGLVDVTWSNPPFDTGLIESGDAVRIAAASELVPEWLDTGLVTTQARLDSDGPLVGAVAQAIAEARRLLRDDPDRAARAWAKGAGLPPAVARQALEDAPDSMWADGLDRKGIDAGLKAGSALGLVEGDVDLDKLLAEPPAVQ